MVAAAGCVRVPQAVIHTQQGEVAINIEVADTQEARSYGLMYRKDLAPDAGMLFVFPREEEQSFWMKNTPLSLDMIFIGTDKQIVGIVADAKPFTTEPRSIGKPSLYVLEVHGGFCAKHSVRVGNRLELRNMPPAAGS